MEIEISRTSESHDPAKARVRALSSTFSGVQAPLLQRKANAIYTSIGDSFTQLC